MQRHQNHAPAPIAAGHPPARAEVSFWLEPLPKLLTRLESSPEGLTGEAATRAAERAAGDRLQGRERFRAAGLALRILANPLVVILLIASVLSAAMGERVSAAIITVMLLLSGTLDFLQSYRSQAAAERLRRSVATTARVLRDGAEVSIPLDRVVPGDVVLLAAGSLVPGDGRLLEARDLHVNEASLTGESLPEDKEAVDLPPTAASITDARNAVFMGTSVISGTARVLVARVGAATEFGKTAQRLREQEEETEFERGIHRFAVLILRTVIFLVLFVFLANVLFRRPAMEAFLFSVALAVGLTPEFLPMIISVSLAAGAVRMARERVIVKRLASIENLGSIDILCSDKTGTITEGRIVLEQHVDLDGREDDEVLLYAAVNSAFETGIRSPMDDAVLAHEHPGVEAYTKVDEIPFDFNRRRISVVVDGPDGRLLVLKGAPESVAPHCGTYRSGAECPPLGAAARDRWQHTFERLCGQGYRVLAIARRAVEPRERYGQDDERDLTFVGFAAFLDPPRADAREMLANLRSDGIQVKVITGDNDLVTRKICGDVGLDVEGMALGSGLDRLDDAALAVLAERTTIFARVSPEQKNRVIHALRARGHVVGYIGDGINDAPSLKAADIGISVEGAADVAKDAADIILLDKSLQAVHVGVLEGRRSFGNIMKYILMGTSSNFGNMFSMAGASVFLKFLPLQPGQLLLNTFLYDLSQVAIPGDTVEPSYLREPRRWNIDLIRQFMMTLGPISSIFDFATFAVLLSLFHAGPELFRAGWFIESLATQVLVIFVIRTPGNPLRSRPHPALVAGAVAAVAAGIFIPYTVAGRWLGFGTPPASFFLFLVPVVLVYLLLVECVKRFFYRRHGLA